MKYFLISLFLFLCITCDVMANDSIYYNYNGVALMKEEMAYIDAMFYNKYKDYMTEDEYNAIFADGIPSIDTIVSEEVVDYNYLRDVSYSTANKKITLKKNIASSTVHVSITAEWLNDPKVRSYDVIGARYNVAQDVNAVFTKVQSNTMSKTYNNTVIGSNGVGCSVLLPINQSNLVISQFFVLTRDSRVTASYQHARSEVSLSDSMNYGFSASGLVGVFAFNNGISSKYDGMLGVYLD